ncbi:Sodium channel protein 60E [Nymphon striatum]|nr:Sodium channel protein 60E [Nymphon striatum]
MTFCVVSKRFSKSYINRYTATKSLFLFSPYNAVRKFAIMISSNQYFDYLVMITILLNCVFLALTNPVEEAEYIFLSIYTLEMVIKAVAKGFILNKYTYLRNPWNWLDFIVIMSGFTTIFMEMIGVEIGNLAGLRTFRVLRALKTVSIMPGMIEDDSKRSVEIDINVGRSNGIDNFLPDGICLVCSTSLHGNLKEQIVCPVNYTCRANIGPNPNYGFTNFDNFGWSMLTTLQLITLDVFENVYNKVIACTGPVSLFFFIVVVFLGSYYLVNLMLAVVAISYEQEAQIPLEGVNDVALIQNNNKSNEASPKSKHNILNVGFLKRYGRRRNLRRYAMTHQTSKDSNKSAAYTDRPSSEVSSSKDGDIKSESNEGRNSIIPPTIVEPLNSPVPADSRLSLADGDLNMANQVLPRLDLQLPIKPTEDGANGNNSSAVNEPEQSSDNSSENQEDSGVVDDHDDNVSTNDPEVGISSANKKHINKKKRSQGLKYKGEGLNKFGFLEIMEKFGSCVSDQMLKVVNDPLFDSFITLCIVVNTAFLAVEHHDMSHTTFFILDVGNKVFTSVFTLEAVLKLIVLKKKYFSSGWNIFDLLVVVASLVDLALQTTNGLSVLRTLRLLRVFKLAQSWVTMRLLLTIIINTLGALGNLTFVLAITIYIFAVLGMQLFGHAYTSERFHPDPVPRWNFTDFYHSIMMIFRILCGEWIEPMWDCMRVIDGPQEMCMIVFLPTLVFGNFLVLNLFLALLLNSFNSEELKNAKDKVNDSRLKQILGRIRTAVQKHHGSVSPTTNPLGLHRAAELVASTVAFNTVTMNTVRRRWLNKYVFKHFQDKVDDSRLKQILGRIRAANRLSGVNENMNPFHEDVADTKLCCISTGHMIASTKSVGKILERSKIKDAQNHTPSNLAVWLAWQHVWLAWQHVWLAWQHVWLAWQHVWLAWQHRMFICKEGNDSIELQKLMPSTSKPNAETQNNKKQSLTSCANNNSSADEDSKDDDKRSEDNDKEGNNAVAKGVQFDNIFNAKKETTEPEDCFPQCCCNSIMGVQFFGGKFYKCVDEEGERLSIEVVDDKWECFEKNYSWVNSKINFDNVGNGYLALFQVATFEGWMEIMVDAIDARKVDEQPEREYNLPAYVYFVVFIICGSFFTLNLFIGVIIDNFNMLKKRYEGGVLDLFLTDSQKNYYTAMKKLGRKKPQKIIKRPSNKYHAIIYDVVMSNKFELLIFLLILMNMIIMAIEHYDQSRLTAEVLEAFNVIFTSLFSCEAIIKIIGLRWSYFTVPWNIFDFLLVMSSIIGIIMQDMIDKVLISPTLLRVVRVFRIGRILRLIKAASGIRKLLFALMISLPALLNIGMLLFLVMFIYALIGMGLFGNVKHTGIIDDQVNFETFGRSMILLFRLITSAGWNDVLDALMTSPSDCSPTAGKNGNCGQPAMAVIFFVSYIFINFLIIINMYIAVILENFNQAHQEEEIGIVEDDLEMFYVRWARYDPHATQFITFSQLADFVASLEAPLGISKPNGIALVFLNVPISDGDRPLCLKATYNEALRRRWVVKKYAMLQEIAFTELYGPDNLNIVTSGQSPFLLSHSRIHCLDILHALTKNVLGDVDESEEFQALQEQMYDRFRKTFPSRSESKITSSTRKRKQEDIAARTIQRAYRNYQMKVFRVGGSRNSVTNSPLTYLRDLSQHILNLPRRLSITRSSSRLSIRSISRGRVGSIDPELTELKTSNSFDSASSSSSPSKKAESSHSDRCRGASVTPTRCLSATPTILVRSPSPCIQIFEEDS